LLLTCSFPVRAHFDERQVIGTLTVTWDLVPVVQRLHSEARLVDGQAGIVLVTRDGIVASVPSSRPERILHRPIETALANTLRSGQRRGHLVESIGGVRHLVGFAHSSSPAGWSVLVVEEAAVAFAPIDRLRGAVLGVGGGVALLAFVLALMGSARLTRPVLELEAAARRVAGGNLAVRLESSSGDEIGSLSRSFDRMVEDLARQRAQLVDKAYVDSLIAGMSEWLFVVDGDGRVQRANPAVLRVRGIAAEQMIGQPAGAMFAEGERAFRERVLDPARRDSSVTEVELGLHAFDGRVVPVVVSAGRLPPVAGTSGIEVVCLAADITQHKMAEAELLKAREAAEAAAGAKARFLAAVSHEVRTPLNGVLGMTDVLAGTSLDDRQREYVETARRSGELLLSLLSDILDYSRMEAGRLELTRVAFDLRSCVADAAELLWASARQANLELSVHVDQRLPHRVVGDPNRLQQVLLNLVSNAIKFTPAGGVVIRAMPVPGAPAQVRFSVSDTGPGIPASDRRRIFEPFQQVDVSSTRRHGGVGLGLAIAQQLVGLMGGSIEITSEEGQGATFAFTAELPPVVEERPQPGLNMEALVDLRVLIVDDNPTNRLVLREMLRAWRCITEEAADGWEALDKARAAAGTPTEFQLALVDYQMPEMDGSGLAREIRADARLAQLPIVLLTSIPQHGDAERAKYDAFAAYLTKPVRQQVLLETLVGVVQGLDAARRRSRLSLVRPGDADSGA
jgi:PAS domain S-box-containing protein